MTYRNLSFDVLLVGAKNVGKLELFPRDEGAKVSVRHEIISEVEASVDLLLRNYDLPDDEQSLETEGWQAAGTICVFDVASKQSFNLLSEFLVFPETESTVDESLLIIGYDRGKEPRQVDAKEIHALTLSARATYLEVSPEFTKGLDVMMRRFASALISHSEK